MDFKGYFDGILQGYKNNGDNVIKTDNNINRFLDPWSMEHNGIGLTDIDDPSFLTFRLNINTNSSILFTNDIKTLQDTEFFYNLSDRNIAYYPPIELLKQLGETQRMNCLKIFRDRFIFLIKNKPFIFQQIDGLEDVMKKFFENNTSFKGTKGDESISITCLESIDLKMNYLFMLYDFAIYDHKYRRRIVPDNLLKFDLEIILSDVRELYNRSLTNNAYAVGNGPNMKSYLGLTKTNLMQTKHKNGKEIFIKPEYTIILKRCQFKPELMTKTISEVNSTTAGEQNTFTFSLSYEDVEVNISGGSIRDSELNSRKMRNYDSDASELNNVNILYDDLTRNDSLNKKDNKFFQNLLDESVNYMKGRGYDFLEDTQGRLSNFITGKISNNAVGGNIENSLEGFAKNQLRNLGNKAENLGRVSIGFLENTVNSSVDVIKNSAEGVLGGVGNILDKTSGFISHTSNIVSNQALGNVGK